MPRECVPDASASSPEEDTASGAAELTHVPTYDTPWLTSLARPDPRVPVRATNDVATDLDRVPCA